MPSQTKTFRLFISSTFSDMKQERAILQNEVFPRLEKLCESKGARFQAVDLRWGVNEESQLDQKTMDICLGEIHRCQKISPMPNFIALIGDRYGWQPIPAKIPTDEMELIEKELSNENKSLIKEWYKKDENAIPSEYLLQPRSEKYREYNQWEQIETTWREQLRLAVDKLEFNEVQKIKYFTSATHQEIINGALNPPAHVENPEEHVFIYTRKIQNLPENQSAKNFIDFSNHQPNIWAKQQLMGLKEKLKTKLGSNYFEYQAKWINDSSAIIDPNGFAENIYLHLSTILKKQMVENLHENEDQNEINIHREFKSTLIQHFCGREEILETIQKYITNPLEGIPFVLTGPSGSGKSSVIAKSIELVESNSSSKVVFRFTGASSRSSDLSSFLSNICAQIAAEYGIALESLNLAGQELQLKGITGLIDLFVKCLSLATIEKPLVIFCDALDQFTETDNVQKTIWVPKQLPPHVKIIVSILPELEIQFKGSLIHHLPLLPEAEAKLILDKWLNNSNRTLTQNQYNHILTSFSANGLSIYLKMAFELAKNWKSYQNDYLLQPDIVGIINGYFDQLEKEHTSELVQHVISYLLCGRHLGLTENELLEVLFFDKAFKHIFLGYTHPDHRNEIEHAAKIPMVAWSRLFLDLEPFLMEKDVYGVPVISFFHRQFIEILKERYKLSQTDEGAITEQLRLHKILADYFNSKPLYYDETKTTCDKPNRRKLVEQPWQQLNANLWNDAVKTLCNVSFIEARSRIGLLDTQQDEFIEAKLLVPADNIKTCLDTFFNVFMEHKHIIKTYPFLTFQQFYNYLQWAKGLANEIIEEMKSEFISNGGMFLHQYKKPEYKESHLIMTLANHTKPVFDCAYSPDGKKIVSASMDNSLKIWDSATGNELATLKGHSNHVNCCSFSHNGKYIISGSMDDSIKIWNAQNYKEIQTLIGHAKGTSSCIFSPDDQLILSVGFIDRNLKIWNAENGELLKTLTGHNVNLYSTAFSPDGKSIISGGGDKSEEINDDGSQTHFVELKLWETETGKEIRSFIGHTNDITSCSFSPDGKYILSGSNDNTIKVWDVKTTQVIKSFQRQNGILQKCAFSPDGTKIVSACGDTILRVWDFNSGNEILALEGHGQVPIGCSFSPDGQFIVSSSMDNTIKLWHINHAHITLSLKEKGAKGSSGCTISGDGKYFVTVNDNNLKFWDAKTGLETDSFQIFNDNINSAIFSPDCSHLALQSDYCIYLLNANTKLITGVLERYSSHVQSYCYSPDGCRLAVGYGDGLIKLWDVASQREIITLYGHSGQITSCKFSPNGNLIASSSWDCTVKIWDVATAQNVRTYRVNGRFVDTCDFSPDGKQIISGGWDHQVSIWDIDTLDDLYSFNTNSRVNFSLFFPDGIYALHCNGKTINIWHITKKMIIAMYHCSGDIVTLALSKCGKRIVCSDLIGNVYFIQVKGFDFETPVLTKAKFFRSSKKLLGFRFDNWDSDYSVICPFCGSNIVTNDSDNKGIDTFISCNHCKGKLKLSNINVDNKERYAKCEYTYKKLNKLGKEASKKLGEYYLSKISSSFDECDCPLCKNTLHRYLEKSLACNLCGLKLYNPTNSDRDDEIENNKRNKENEPNHKMIKQLNRKKNKLYKTNNRSIWI